MREGLFQTVDICAVLPGELPTASVSRLAMRRVRICGSIQVGYLQSGGLKSATNHASQLAHEPIAEQRVFLTEFT